MHATRGISYSLINLPSIYHYQCVCVCVCVCVCEGCACVFPPLLRGVRVSKGQIMTRLTHESLFLLAHLHIFISVIHDDSPLLSDYLNKSVPVPSRKKKKKREKESIYKCINKRSRRAHSRLLSPLIQRVIVSMPAELESSLPAQAKLSWYQ